MPEDGEEKRNARERERNWKAEQHGGADGREEAQRQELADGVDHATIAAAPSAMPALIIRWS
jgi:hypothetical protein